LIQRELNQPPNDAEDRVFNSMDWFSSSVCRCAQRNRTPPLGLGPCPLAQPWGLDLDLEKPDPTWAVGWGSRHRRIWKSRTPTWAVGWGSRHRRIWKSRTPTRVVGWAGFAARADLEKPVPSFQLTCGQFGGVLPASGIQGNAASLFTSVIHPSMPRKCGFRDMRAPPRSKDQGSVASGICRLRIWALDRGCVILEEI
jgi:hypothetical protein